MSLTFRVYHRSLWRLVDEHGDVVAHGEPYDREADVRAALNWVTGASAGRLAFRKWQDGNGRWHWGLLALEGTDTVAFGGPFDDESQADQTMKQLLSTGPRTPVLDDETLQPFPPAPPLKAAGEPSFRLPLAADRSPR